MTEVQEQLKRERSFWYYEGLYDIDAIGMLDELNVNINYITAR